MELNKYGLTFPLLFMGTVVLLMAITIYHVRAVESHQEKWAALQQEVNGMNQSLQSCKANLTALERDMERFQHLYQEQSTELEYAEAAQLLALFHEAGAATECVPETTASHNGMTELSITAAVNKTVPLHVLVDGKYQDTIQLDGSGQTEIELTSTGQEIALVTRENVPVSLSSIQLDGTDIPVEGFIDTGGGPELFDCDGKGLNNRFTKSAWRTRVKSG